MTYKLNITENADSLLNSIIYHLLYHLKSKQAAKHLLDRIDAIYERLENNPLQFPKSKDTSLAKKGYREAIIPQMNYIIVFSISENTVNIVGIFHQSENRSNKILT